MPQIRTHIDAKNMINASMGKALENTYARMYDELMLIIEHDVYEAGDPQWYDREHAGGTFKEAFYYTKFKPGITGVSVKLGYDAYGEYAGVKANKWKLLVTDIENFVHGSRAHKGEDGEKWGPSGYWLPQMINDGEPSIGDLFGEGYWRQPRPFWDDFLLWVADNMDEIFQEEMQAQGLKVRRSIRYSGGQFKYPKSQESWE